MVLHVPLNCFENISQERVSPRGQISRDSDVISRDLVLLKHDDEGIIGITLT